MLSVLIPVFLLNLNSLCSLRIHYLSINENDITPRHLLTFNSPHSFYKLLSKNIYLQKYFSIENQRELFLVESLDREYICKKSLCSCLIPCTIELKILAQPDYEIIHINLTINDLNDNLHYFRLKQIELHIPENTNNRQCYRIPLVNDEDLPSTNEFIYQLIGNGSEKFEIDQIIGNDLCLKIKNISLDREESNQYDHLWIIAEDKQKQQAKINIIIHVKDINDNSPKFLTNSTIIHLNETFTGKI
jgi:hypothetical protein